MTMVESGRPRVRRVSSKSLVRANRDSLTRWAWIRQEGRYRENEEKEKEVKGEEWGQSEKEKENN